MRTATCALLVGVGCLCLVVVGCRKSKDEALEMGAIAFVNKDYDLAIRCYSDVIRRDPKDISAYCCRGLAYGHKGDYDKGFADFDEAIRLDPKHGDTYRRRALVYEMKGEKDKAKADYAKARELGRAPRTPPAR
jgi:Tfp pilus assembly protein PilF